MSEATIEDKKIIYIEKIKSMITFREIAEHLKNISIPLIGILVFLLFWASIAPKINTSLGSIPGPAGVYDQFKTLVNEHLEEREKEEKFYQRQEERNAKKLEKNPDAKIKVRQYTGKPTFFDQIFTSLYTVLTGFVLASLIAIPIGIASGLNKTIYAAINPVIQVFKPISPLAWLPIVTMVVSAVYVSDDPLFQKSFITSMITVMLCCL